MVARFGGELDPRELQDARLLTSELVTNAVVHGRGPVGLTALLDEDRPMIEVVDQDDGFERVVREQGLEAVGGHGLNIVDAPASRWGLHAGSATSGSNSNAPGRGSEQTTNPASKGRRPVRSARERASATP